MSNEIKEIIIGFCHYDHPKGATVRTDQGEIHFPVYDYTEQNDFCHNHINKDTLEKWDLMNGSSMNRDCNIKCKTCFYFKPQKTEKITVQSQSNIIKPTFGSILPGLKGR